MNIEELKASKDPHPVIAYLKQATFKIQDLPGVYSVANMIAQACPNSNLAAIGVTEILLNAVEHGNLGITYEEKTKLQKEATWIQEIERRLTLPENLEKYVTIEFQRFSDRIQIRVIDQGEGFDWKKFDTLDDAKSLHTHGRGIPMAKSLVFSKLEFRGKGNEVIGIIPL